VALFRATTVRRVIPSKPSPHNGSLALFRGSFASLQLSTNVLKRVALRLIAVSFLNSHEYTQLLDSPNDYELPFHEPKSASWSSWAPCDRTISFRQLRLLRSVYPLCKSVHNQAELPRNDWSLLSWVSIPLQFSLSTPLSLDPLESENPNTAFTRRISSRLKGSCNPSCQVRTSPIQ
jgi:hypothetical protein